MSAGSGIIWRILEADAVVGGHAIPRGATVVAPIACIHHDAQHWPEPERFLPSRFLEGDASIHQMRLLCRCVGACTGARGTMHSAKSGASSDRQ